ncbi:DEAD/DEAH box helicase family protein [Oxalobacter sp. OttesenSCG-928-P03]|nr:DEAD/DEAH box helicase family protein [Oxalobacter sp. OttesenSCG-928-P03]
MKKIISIAHSAVTAKLVNADRAAMLEVQRLLSYRVDGVEHMAAFKAGRWDGRSSFFDYKSSTFPRGFVGMVSAGLQKAGYQVNIVKKPFPAPLGAERPVVDAFGESERYGYQYQVTDRLVRHGQIIAQVATGGGKSRIAQLCTARISRPTLFLTTRGILMYQMAEKFEAMGKRTAILGDGSLQISKDVTCATVQTIMSWLTEITPEAEMERELKSLKRRKVPEERWPSEMEMVESAKRKALTQAAKRKKMIEVLKTFEFVILEEAHESSGSGYFEILKHCEKAHYRLALTATPFMKDDEEANMRLMASSGPVAIRVTEEELINKGILAKPYFKFLPLSAPPKKLFKTTPWQRAVELGVVKNDLRNDLIVEECTRANKFGLSVMILVQRKEHGNALLEKLTFAGLKAAYILGEDNQAERKAALSALSSKSVDVLIGTTILDVGVDVPAVGMVILAGGGKAEVGLRQRIGRGLREKKDGSPNVAFIVDFDDDYNFHLKSHAKQRQSIIQSTPGFQENIVTDFDFKGLGLKEVA